MPLTKSKRWLILCAVMLAFLPIVIDMTILHIAVPSLTQALGASNTQILWIIDIYPLIMAGILVPMGSLADRIGNRQMLLSGLCVFAIASLLAAFSSSPAMLISSRVLLALGGSMIMPCILGIIRRTFEDERERAMALGLWGTIGAAGAALGPLLGGALLEHFWWGSVFLINVPLMAIVLPTVYTLLPRAELKTSGKWPIGQALLFIVSIISLVYGIKSALGSQQSSLIALLSLLAGAVLLIVFVQRQLTSHSPMLDLSLFKHPSVLAGIIMASVTIGALAGVELTLAMELQYVLEKTPLQAGVFMIPIMAAAAVGGPVAGYLSNLLGLRWVASTSLAISACALAALAMTDFHIPGLTIPLLLATLGLALSIGLTSSSIAIMDSVEASQGGAAGALEATSYELGTGLGITAFGVFMSIVYSHTIALPAGLDPALAERASRSIGDTFIVAAQASNYTETLTTAARAAFSNTHSILLGTSALVLGLLAGVVFMLFNRHSSSKQH